MPEKIEGDLGVSFSYTLDKPRKKVFHRLRDLPPGCFFRHKDQGDFLKITYEHDQRRWTSERPQATRAVDIGSGAMEIFSSYDFVFPLSHNAAHELIIKIIRRIDKELGEKSK